MPAAAVIPAPIAYIKVVAVKKLVVGSRGQARRSSSRRFHCRVRPSPHRLSSGALRCVPKAAGTFTLKKLECSKQAFSPEYWRME